jgi:SAM-dependent methyltransferase
MGQVTTGFRTILSHPYLYSMFQYLMGAHQGRIRFISDFVRPVPGSAILDIGCGTADILDYLPCVDYWGFDINLAYIDQAKARFGVRGKFQCQELKAADLDNLMKFDIVLAIGLLHHLDDTTAVNTLVLAHRALKREGHLLTIDPCIEPGQNPIARFLVTHDRGQHVRTSEGYAALVSSIFMQPRVEVIHRSWIPYTHCIMQCTRQ